jgi:hypothetical protein
MFARLVPPPKDLYRKGREAASGAAQFDAAIMNENSQRLPAVPVVF